MRRPAITGNLEIEDRARWLCKTATEVKTAKGNRLRVRLVSIHVSGE